MKRALCVCLVLVLMLGLSVAASALGGVTVETAGDVAPGSTVLVSVTVEGGVDVVGCQIEPLFDTTMFQLVSYHWSLRPDSEMTDPASGAWVAEWLTPVTLRGKVLTFTLKVLPGAAGKAASISCRIDAWDEGFEPVDLGEVTAAQIGGTCAHTYGQKEDPAYIQTPGDCRNATVYFVSCTKCGQKGTGTFIGKQLGDHVYTAKLETEDRLAQKGDCVTGSRYYYSCTGCGQPGTEVFTSAIPAGHNFGAKTETEAYLSDPGDCQTRRSYYYSCTGCGLKGTEVFSSEKKFGVHQYANDCDSDCNVCGKYQEPKHQPDTRWSTDAAGHWYVCLQCRQRVDYQPHVPGPEATAEEHQVCTVCQYVLAVSDEHRCEFSPEWSYDERNHWHACSCGLSGDLDAHDWVRVETDRTDVVMSRCGICGMVREEQTQPSTEPTTPPTLPTDTQPTRPQEPAEPSGSSNVAVIVLSILLGLSLAANGVLGYLLYMTKKAPKGPDKKGNG